MTLDNPVNKPETPLVLVVDDDMLVREFFREELEAVGCSTVVAANGVQALERVAAQLPQLILLDINMPEMDGLEVLRRLKRNPVTKAIPILMITAAQDTNDVEAAFKLGAANYVLKPIQRDQFMKKVRETLAASGYVVF